MNWLQQIVRTGDDICENQVFLDEGSRRIRASAIGSKVTLFKIDHRANQPRWNWLPFPCSAVLELIPGPLDLRRVLGQPDPPVT